MGGGIEHSVLDSRDGPSCRRRGRSDIRPGRAGGDVWSLRAFGSASAIARALRHALVAWRACAPVVFLVAGLVLTCWVNPSSAAQQPGESVLCRPGQENFQAAEAALAALDLLMSDSNKEADVQTLRDAVAALVAGPCFKAVPSWPRPADSPFMSVEALRHFWSQGGRDAFAQFLVVDSSSLGRVRSFPTVRESMSTHPALVALQGGVDCSVEDADCAKRAEHLREKAQSALDALPGPARPGQQPGLPACNRDARAMRPELRWEAWVRCAEASAPRRSMLPLGLLRVPAEGWLVLHGRRGHYNFCDEVRVYDLTEGSAYVVSQCGSRFSTERKGLSDAQGEHPTRVHQAGQADVQKMRELLWMMLVAPAVRDDVLEAPTAADLPAEVVPQAWDRSVLQGPTVVGSHGSDETELSWSWVVSSQTRASGTIRWPTDRARRGFAHAAALLRAFEETFVSGCPARELPASWSDGLPESGAIGELAMSLGSGEAQDACRR